MRSCSCWRDISDGVRITQLNIPKCFHCSAVSTNSRQATGCHFLESKSSHSYWHLQHCPKSDHVMHGTSTRTIKRVSPRPGQALMRFSNPNEVPSAFSKGWLGREMIILHTFLHKFPSCLLPLAAVYCTFFHYLNVAPKTVQDDITQITQYERWECFEPWIHLSCLYWTMLQNRCLPTN